MILAHMLMYGKLLEPWHQTEPRLVWDDVTFQLHGDKLRFVCDLCSVQKQGRTTIGW